MKRRKLLSESEIRKIIRRVLNENEDYSIVEELKENISEQLQQMQEQILNVRRQLNGNNRDFDPKYCGFSDEDDELWNISDSLKRAQNSISGESYDEFNDW